MMTTVYGAGAAGAGGRQAPPSSPVADAPPTPLPLRSIDELTAAYAIDYDSLAVGIGASGPVRPCVPRGADGQPVAGAAPCVVKFLRNVSAHQAEVRLQRRAARVSSRVVPVLDVFAGTMVRPGDCVRRDWLAVVMPRMGGGELFDFLKDRRRLPEADARQMVRQIAEALRDLHAQGIVHRDIKPENVLLSRAVPAPRAAPTGSGSTDNSVPASPLADPELLDLRLCDFGFATDQQPAGGGYTANYVSPEQLTSIQAGKLGRREPYTAACDMWALGVMLYIALSGLAPFYTRSRNRSMHVPPDMRQQIMRADYNYPERAFRGVSAAAKAVIDSLLQADPAKRPTAPQLLASPWLCSQTQPEVPARGPTEPEPQQTTACAGAAEAATPAPLGVPSIVVTSNTPSPVVAAPAAAASAGCPRPLHHGSNTNNRNDIRVDKMDENEDSSRRSNNAAGAQPTAAPGAQPTNSNSPGAAAGSSADTPAGWLQLEVEVIGLLRQLINVVLPAGATVLAAKKKIAALRPDLPERALRLVAAGQLLEDPRPLTSYNLPLVHPGTASQAHRVYLSIRTHPVIGAPPAAGPAGQPPASAPRPAKLRSPLALPSTDGLSDYVFSRRQPPRGAKNHFGREVTRLIPLEASASKLLHKRAQRVLGMAAGGSCSSS